MARQSRLSDFLWQTHEGKDEYLRRLKTAVIQTAVMMRKRGEADDRGRWARNAVYDPDRFTGLMAPAVLVHDAELAEKILNGEEYEDVALLAAVAELVDVFA